MPTVSELIHSSFRLIGAIAAGETLETTELNDAFVSLNQMIASWNTEGLSLAGRQRLIIPVTTMNSYGLSQRPVKIDAASVAISGIDCPLELVDAAGWEAISEKAALAIFIQKLYCDYQYPNSTVYLWPTPRMTGNLELWIYAAIAPFPDVNQTIDLPPGYEAALRYNFAIALLPEYPRSQADPTLPAQAQNYKASLVQLNAQNHAKTLQPTAATVAAQGTA
jgi:hypothetical protein